MFYLASLYWPWLLGAVLLGFLIGWIAVVHRSHGLSRRTSWWVAGMIAASLAVASARLLPGRPGYWLDLGLVMIAAYLSGCAMGSRMRHWVISRYVHAG